MGPVFRRAQFFVQANTPADLCCSAFFPAGLAVGLSGVVIRYWSVLSSDSCLFNCWGISDRWGVIRLLCAAFGDTNNNGAMAPPNPARQRLARAKLDEIYTQPSSAFVVHYACQSFDEEDQRGALRVTAVAARNLGTGETTAFSIGSEAKLAGLGPVQILSRFDELEGRMLEKFFAFVKDNWRFRFLHWHMDGPTFGFAALENRLQALGRQPFVLPEAQKTNLAILLTDIYGAPLADKPVFQSLAELNELPYSGVIAGRAEADAFEEGAYGAVRRSSEAKVLLFARLAQMAHDRTLKTNASWWSLNTGRLREALELFDRNPVQAWAGLVVAGVTGGATLVWSLF